MEIGIRLPGAGAKVSPENLATIARWAEELGYHSVWVSDHVALPEQVDSFYPYDSQGRWPYPADTKWLDPFLALAWAASVAPSVKLGTSVLVVPLRNPVLLAKQLSTLDFISGGRVILGVGAGWMEEEFTLIGESFANRGKRVVEMVKLMRQLWSGATVDFQGEFYHVSGCQMYPRPLQPTIPVVWGGHSEAALKRVARVGDGWHPTQISLAQLAEGIKQLRHYCREFGRDPDSVLIVARPGRVYPITAETQAQHLALGIHHLIIDPPLDGPDLSAFRSEMERVAAVCGLPPRH